MKRFFKTLLYTIFIALLLVQLYPRPKKNVSTEAGSNDIAAVHQVSADVMEVLKTSCYDCHSNNTVYPWYSTIQPVALFMGNHVDEGKRELNFSEFGRYSVRRKYHKLEEINEQIKEGEMPLSSYTLIHRNAKLNENQKLLVANWAESLRDSLRKAYPPDSFARRK